MAYNPADVMRRDRNQCRFRLEGCIKHATTIMLDVPEFLGGMSTDANARAACRPCTKEMLHQRNRAAALFGYVEGR
jgi:hypothetical protein